MHLFFKKGVNALSFHDPLKFSNSSQFFRRLFSVPWIWCGILSVATSLSIWLVVLSQVNLSVAYPFDSLQYIIVLPFSFLLFREHLDRRKVLGSALILLGIWFVSSIH
jgi:drug/metabolite transporter (DMT)-like permease